MNSLNRFNSILHYFSISLFIRQLNFSRFESFIIYYNIIVFLNNILKLILIIKKSFTIIISYNRLIIKITL